MRHSIFVILAISILTFSAIFSPPVDRPRITSTFGEFRSMGSRGPHFHMGADFSTALSEGKPIYAAADGYLVRIEIDEDDIYGYTIVLEHEGGYRTLYAHMSAFAPKLKRIVEDLKREFGDERIVVEFPRNEIFFKKGEIVGFSGKTGEATWPHVHFEVRNQEESVSFDPLPFLSSIRRPVDEEIVVEKIAVDGVVKGYEKNMTMTFKGDYPRIEVLAYSIGFSNKLGLKSLTLEFNGEEVFKISFDSIPWSEFENVYSVYSERSKMTAYTFKPWYALYPKGGSSLVKINKMNRRFPDTLKARIILKDAWGMTKEIELNLRRER